MLRACQRQFRMGGMGGPVGMDFGAMLAMGTALRADNALLAELLPAVEGAALAVLVDTTTDDQDEMSDGG